MRLAPSILSFDLTDLRQAVPSLEAAGAAVIHLDVMDGQFVPPITFGQSLVSSLRPLVSLPFEAHLMTLTPERHFESFAEAGCQGIIFHVEATQHAYRLAQTLQTMGLQAGVAINPGTPAEAVEPLLGTIDHVLVMTVNPGWGGQEFLRDTLKKVKRIHTWRPDLCIEVDGGIGPDTIKIATDAGASLFVVGSYLANAASIDEAVEELRRACA